MYYSCHNNQYTPTELTIELTNYDIIFYLKTTIVNSVKWYSLSRWIDRYTQPYVCTISK